MSKIRPHHVSNYIIRFALISSLFKLGFPTPIAAQSPTTSFYYDSSGARIGKVSSDADNVYYISPSLEVVIASDGTKTYRRNYAYNGRIVAVREDGNVNYLHQDHLGSTALVTNSSGNVTAQQVYYPYGETRTEDGNLPTEREYTGQVSDTDTTGLYYYNARYYNPTIAKFTQADTVNDGLNSYSYVANNPVNALDPSGNLSCKSIPNKQLQRICQIAEIGYYYEVATSSNPDKTREDIQNAKKQLFTVRDSVDVTTSDLVRYRGIYESMVWGGFLLNKPYSARLMSHFLHGAGQTVDVSDQMQAYVDAGGDFNSEYGRAEVPWIADKNSGKLYTVGISAIMMPFFDNPNTETTTSEFDTLTAVGDSTFSLTFDSHYWGINEANGVAGIFIEDPVLEFYDIYNWDQDALISFDLPILGNIWIADNMGKVLTEQGAGIPFEITGSVQLHGTYFVSLTNYVDDNMKRSEPLKHLPEGH